MLRPADSAKTLGQDGQDGQDGRETAVGRYGAYLVRRAGRVLKTPVRSDPRPSVLRTQLTVNLGRRVLAILIILSILS